MKLRFANEDLRSAAKAKGVRVWQLAEKLNVSETTMAKLLRHELPNEKKTRLLAIIDEIAAENGFVDDTF